MTLEAANEIFRTNNHLCRFSNDGRFLAFAFQGNLVIKNTGTFDTFLSFPFVDIIEYIEWSPDSEYILCATFKKAIIQVFSICYPDWRCKLTEGSVGLEQVTWAPDSRHIITTGDFNIQISIWSLESRSVTYIQNIKSSFSKVLNFSGDGKRLALVLNNGESNVALYKTKNWKISRKLICERLKSIDGISWSPNSDLLCIWSSDMIDSKLLIFSTASESLVGSYVPDEETKDCEYTKNEFSRKLKGINRVKWITGGQLLAVVGHGELIVLLNYLTWKPLLSLYHDPIIRENNYRTKVYKECVMQVKDSNKQPSLHNRHIMEEVNARPISLPVVKRDLISGNSVPEIDILEFSACGRYLATRHQSYPTTLWIWNILSDTIDYLILQNMITSVLWSPTGTSLLAFTETSNIFEWSPDYAACVPTPKRISVADARWHPHGKIAVLCGYNKAVIYFGQSCD
ncbi:WD repeat-containing protein WRAP73-like [Neodiprion virginianus]|uniref:WD repeat-containing protein WRAP73-like n=1 Tax=Neodiprion virginianus TaxID=2961670 RepID=UPI001EE75592|nr:WD repeat-containing protein WRAP73-like [Neodiprion virginianus]XP_046611079.1 WD repeat-containing protein WRAP73-like [Neodiprion virginianus]XP_046611080.1 WD repeat-containing protein WRAP73-like [Neodiprion virginianus]XP_046611081.1 WD repeat-containing protein WRAP73-like [Neodiprion virginianus]